MLDYDSYNSQQLNLLAFLTQLTYTFREHPVNRNNSQSYLDAYNKLNAELNHSKISEL